MNPYSTRLKMTLLFLVLLTCTGLENVLAKQPNILFIAVDDLNHWVGYTGRNPQCKTPNIDRLAAMGVSFTNAHCAAPACGPSRAALWSGIRPHSSGCYLNADPWKNHIAEGLNLNAHLKNYGYYTAAMGKTYHSSSGGLKTVYASEWDQYPPTRRGQSAGRAPRKNEGYHEPLEIDLQDEDLPDWHTVDFCIEQLKEKRNKPFFLACGLSKPHLPWAVPRKYYEHYPLESIQLPPHKKDDLDDIPAAGVKVAGPEKDHAKFLQSGRWKDAVRSYLATIAYTDMNIGRLLDAYEKSPERDNTIVVLWGDHGWHLGEKQHWRKFALWEEATRSPLIWVAPGITTGGERCEQPVDFLSIYPTLCELVNVPTPNHAKGASMATLLKNPHCDWDGVALTTHGYRNHALRDRQFRYIRYSDGSEELYDHVKDPYEYTNLAQDPVMAATKQRLAAFLPSANTPPTTQTRKKHRKNSS